MKKKFLLMLLSVSVLMVGCGSSETSKSKPDQKTKVESSKENDKDSKKENKDKEETKEKEEEKSNDSSFKGEYEIELADGETLLDGYIKEKNGIKTHLLVPSKLEGNYTWNKDRQTVEYVLPDDYYDSRVDAKGRVHQAYTGPWAYELEQIYGYLPAGEKVYMDEEWSYDHGYDAYSEYDDNTFTSPTEELVYTITKDELNTVSIYGKDFRIMDVFDEEKSLEMAKTFADGTGFNYSRYASMGEVQVKKPINKAVYDTMTLHYSKQFSTFEAYFVTYEYLKSTDVKVFGVNPGMSVLDVVNAKGTPTNIHVFIDRKNRVEVTLNYKCVMEDGSEAEVSVYFTNKSINYHEDENYDYMNDELLIEHINIKFK